MLWWMVRVLAYPMLETTASLPELALAMALWACVALAMVRYWRARRSPAARGRLMLFAGLVLVLLANAAITGYGRGGTPIVPSRYGTLLLLDSVLWLVAVADLMRGDGGAAEPRAGVRVVLCALAVGLLLVHGNRYRDGLTIMQPQRPNREDAREAVAYYLSDHSPNLPFQGFKIFPPHVQQQGDLARPELLAVLPPDMLPSLTALPVMTRGDAWASNCALENIAPDRPRWSAFNSGTATPAPAQAWGTACRGAAAVGRIRVGPIAIHDPVLRIPIAGYPGTPDTALIIQDATDARHRIQYAGGPPGDAWSNWDADVSAFVGHDVYLFGVDSARQAPGWLAFGRPRADEPRAVAVRPRPEPHGPRAADPGPRESRRAAGDGAPPARRGPPRRAASRRDRRRRRRDPIGASAPVPDSPPRTPPVGSADRSPRSVRGRAGRRRTPRG